MENNPVPHESSRILPRYLTRHNTQAHQISRLLHDELSQSMTALRLQLAVLEMAQDNQRNENQQHLHTSIAMVEEVIKELREVSRTLYPTALDAANIGQALSDTCQRVADQTNIVITYRGGYGDPLPDFLQVLLYRFTHETVRMLAEMEGTRHITVNLEQDAEKVAMSIQAMHRSPSNKIWRESMFANNPVIEDIIDEVSLLEGLFVMKAETDLVTDINLFIPIPEDL
jgi:signal transduction histidine kinase